MPLQFYIKSRHENHVLSVNGFLADIIGPFPTIEVARQWCEANLAHNEHILILAGFAPLS